jgi:hypothetical protein
MFRKPFVYGLFIFVFVFHPCAAKACESCAASLARSTGENRPGTDRFFADFTFEMLNWDADDSRGVHNLHHEGHHVHNKTHEEFYHFALGFDPVEAVTLLAELPYVVRTSTEVDNHARLGRRERSEGVGDLRLTGTWRFLREGKSFLGAVAGVKLPTGPTDEENSGGDLFEMELQPGSGSTDAIGGAAFRAERGPWALHGNALYTAKTEGDRDFEFGDHFAVYVVLDALLTPENAPLGVRVGADLNFQVEGKETDDGVKIASSGGTTVLLGPALTLETGGVRAFGNLLFPVHQNLGGVHQEIDFAVNAGVRAAW